MAKQRITLPIICLMVACMPLLSFLGKPHPILTKSIPKKVSLTTRPSPSYHMYGVNMGTLSLELSIDNGSTWNALWSESGDKGSNWFSATIDDIQLDIEANCACIIAGNADTHTSQSGVDNVSNAYGAPNGTGAKLYQKNDQVILDLSDELASGSDYVITWRRDPGTGDTPSIRVEESSNGNNWTNAAGSPFGFDNTTYFDQTITASTNTRYLRFTTLNGFNVDLDAVSYNIPCPPDCTSFAASTTDITCGNTDGSILISNLENAEQIEIRLESPDGSGNWTTPLPKSNSPTGGTYTISDLAVGAYRLEVYGYDANGGSECLTTLSPTIGTPTCTEICDDGIDNNGNGKIDYQDELCEMDRPRIGRQAFGGGTGANPARPNQICEETAYIFEVQSPQDGFTYSWDFGLYADSTSAMDVGPHTIQFDAPTDTIGILSEVILISSTGAYDVRDTLPLYIRPLPKITTVNINPPSSCGGNDGILALEVSKDTSACIQISLDAGVTWEADDQLAFITLGSGDYEIMMRYCDSGCSVSHGVVTIKSPFNFVLLDDDFENNCPGQIVQNAVSLNDTLDGGIYIYSIAKQANWGIVTINNTGAFEYTSTTATCGTDQFDYQVCDLSGTCCGIATVALVFSDSIAPQMTNVPIDMTVSCDELIPVPELVGAFDNCPAVSINVEEESTQGEDGCSQHHYTLKRTWIAEDVCGNTVRDSQTIEVQDFTAPNIFRIYTLPNGKKLVAGVMENVNQNWKTISLPINFSTTPIIFSQVVSTKESTPVTTRIKNITSAQFQLKIQEELANDTVHLREKVAWIAIEKGIQTQEFELNAGTFNLTEALENKIFSSSFNEVPAFFVGMQTTQDEDPANVRYEQLTTSAVDVRIQEEISADANTNHREERVGYLALDNIGIMVDQAGKPLGEVGTVTLNSTWDTIKTDQMYHNPVVITSGLSSNDTTTATIRVRNVKPGSFEVRIEDWDYENSIHAAETVSYLVVEGSIPLDASSICDTGSDGLEIGVDLIAIDNCDPSVTIHYEEGQVVNGANLQTVRTWFVEDECGNSNGYSQVVNCTGLTLRLKGLLQGALVGNEDEMMRDDLREKGLLPTTEPYSDMRGYTHINHGGGEECSIDLLTKEGPDAIVDWVFIELRDATNSDLVLATLSGLIQRDGDIVNERGDTLIELYNMPPGNYYVGLKHRNHLPVISLRPYTFSTNKTPYVDFSYEFTPSRGYTPTVEVDSRRASWPGDLNGNHIVRKASWSGDLNGDGSVIFQGPSNDVFHMFLEILLDIGNTNRLTNYISDGYTENDFNMDGTVIYQGPNNDKASLLWNTIFKHPDNDLEHSNFIVSTKETVENTEYLACELDNSQNPCDFDGDGQLNETDPDDDDDGVADGDDVDPFDPESDSDFDGVSDNEETGEDGMYHIGIDSDPLSACDPENTHIKCKELDNDNDGCYPNYRTDHALFDPDDWNTCYPLPSSPDCGCADEDGDGYILVCHGKEDGFIGRKIKIPISEWVARQALGDICGPCQ